MGGVAKVSAPVLVSVGLCTPLGYTTRATQCAIAAGLSCFKDTEVKDRQGEPARAAWLENLNADASRDERIAYFGTRAMHQCLAEVELGQFEDLPVFVALPEEGSGGSFSPDVVKSALQRETPSGANLDWSPQTYSGGRAGFFQALDAAVTEINRKSKSAALVGGCDSLCDRESLDALVRKRRILGADSFDGLIPGEGAGFLLLMEAGAARKSQLQQLALIENCALGRDAEPFTARSPWHAVGLTQLFNQLRLADPNAPRVDAFFSCQTGESFWAKELSLASMRNPSLMPEPQRELLLAENLGDVGAAAGAIQVAMVLHIHSRGQSLNRKLERALVYGAADGGDVGGCIISVVLSSP